MTVGTGTYMGLAVPLYGEVELKQDTAATDFITLTGDSSISGDFLVCRAGATEKAWVTSAGKLHAAGGLQVHDDVVIATGKTLKFSAPFTTAAATTGYTIGDVFLMLKSTTPQLVTCTSSVGNVLYYRPADTQTFGRATSP
jgi:hypothetical protein